MPTNNALTKWLWLCSIIVTVALTVVAYRSLEDVIDKWTGTSSEKPVQPASNMKADHSAVHFHGNEATIQLKKAARENAGLDSVVIKRRPFPHTLTVPAVIVERPGRCNVIVAAPLEGIVTDVHFLAGEKVKPKQEMFTLRLTHEELMQGQAEYLRTLVALDVVNREITRLSQLSDIAGGELRERRYDREKYQADLKAQRQGLILHGIPDERVRDEIDKQRTLIKTLTVSAPAGHRKGPGEEETHLYQMEKLKVAPGQHVKTGQELCVLADHSELFIQGKAFEQDGQPLNESAANGWDCTAVFSTTGGGTQEISGLKILYVDSEIDEDSRALPFYVTLPNELLPMRNGDASRFIGWKYKPGQRLQLRVTVKQGEPRLVVPSAAVVGEGLDRYVFVVGSGGHYYRRKVLVEHQDWRHAVLAEDKKNKFRDGKTEIVTVGAYQLHLAIRQHLQGGGGGGHGHAHPHPH